MSHFYTNVATYGNKILLREIGPDGHKNHRIEFQPAIFVPTNKESEYKDLYGFPVEKIYPGTIKDTREFIKQYDGIEGFDIYGNTNYIAQFISDNYTDDIDYTLSKIRVANIDIEVAPPPEGGFPHASKADGEINAITIYDNIENTYFVWGLEKYGAWCLKDTELEFITDENIVYKAFSKEFDMLCDFLTFWNTAGYDVVTGWNIEGFDIPYLVNRGYKVVGEKVTKKLSPWGQLRERTLKGSYGNESITYELVGISVLDYLALYKKFTYSVQESYTLDHIAFVELGENKLDYSEAGNLHTLYLTNFQKYVDYNVKDVDLVRRIDDKMKLLDLIFTVAYYAKVNYNDVFSPVKTWDTIIFNTLKADKIVIPPQGHNEKGQAFEGAYVKEPKVGFSEWIVSVDLNSLYPHLIMQYNLGPDTIIDEERENIPLTQLIDKEADLSHITNSMAANGTMYRKDKRGLLPDLMERLYKERKANKKTMLGWEQKKADGDKSAEVINNISKYDNLQMAMKILLNSAYGAVGNPYFRYYDLRIAEAITISGQLSIRWIARKINEFMNKTLNTEGKDYVIAIDTDSNYIEFGDLVKKVFPEGTDKTKIVDTLDMFIKEKFEPFLKESYDELAEYMNAFENKMVMEREVIADKGFWTVKKRYVLNVYDSEGVRYPEPKLKVMGLESKRSSTPAICRDKLKEAYKLMVTKDESDIHDFISGFKKEWKQLPADEIASP